MLRVSPAALRALTAKSLQAPVGTGIGQMLVMLIIGTGIATAFGIGGVLLDLVVVALLITVQTSANEAFGREMDSDNLRFLETLPVRRTEVWLVMVLEPVALAVLSLLAIAVPVALTWSPGRFAVHAGSGVGVMGHGLGPYHLGIGTGALLALGIGVAALVRASGTRGAAATGATTLVTGLWLVAEVIFFSTSGFSPSLADMAPIHAVQAATLLAMSLVCFQADEEAAASPTDRIVGVLVLGLLVLNLGLLELTAGRWERIRSWDLVAPIAIDPHAAPEGQVLLRVRDPRSGEHVALLDRARSPRSIARRASPLDQRGDGELTLQYTSGLMDALRGRAHPVRRVDLEGEVLATLSLGSWEHDGRLFHVTRFRWTPSGRSFAFSAERHGLEGFESYLVVVDAEGRPLLEQPVPGRWTLHVGAPDRVGWLGACESGSCTLTVHDLDSGTETRSEVPGQPLALSEDLERVATLLETEEPGQVVREVWVHAFDGTPPRRIASPAGIPPRAVVARESMQRERVRRTLDGELRRRREDGVPFEQILPHRPVLPEILFTPTLATGVSVRVRVDGEFLTQELVAFDTGGSGGGRVLMGSDELRPIHAIEGRVDDASTVAVHGFDPTGRAVVVETEGRVSRVELASGRREVLLDTSRLGEDGRREMRWLAYPFVVSPSADRACVRGQESLAERAHPPLYRHRLYCQSDGELRLVFEAIGGDDAGARWIDDEHVLLRTSEAPGVTRAGAIDEIRFDGGETRRIFPPAEGR